MINTNINQLRIFTTTKFQSYRKTLVSQSAGEHVFTTDSKLQSGFRMGPCTADRHSNFSLYTAWVSSLFQF